MPNRVFIHILYATTPNAEPAYTASETPLTIAYEGAPKPTDRMFYSYEELRDGLIQRFGVPELMVPNQRYFDATPDEREIVDDPIYRTVTF
jgi:hypothetical protein